MSSTEKSGEKPKDFMITPPSYDFTDANTKHDTVLIVEDTKFYVTSGFLSTWSEYFEGLFGSDFKDATSKEIEIREVSAEDFKEFLNFIYPSQAKISETSVIPLIKMAHRFLAPGVMVACKEFIDKNFDKIDIFNLLEVVITFNIDYVKGKISSLICASPLKGIGIERCTKCKYGYEGKNCCEHQDTKGSTISVNAFIYENQDRICNMSKEAESFILKASVGFYEKE